MNRRQRRAKTKQWEQLFEQWRQQSRKFAPGDVFNHIETFELFEDCDGDKSADVLIACDLLEQLPDVDAALQKMKGLARKMVAFIIKPDEVRTIAVWKNVIGRYFPIPERNGITQLPMGSYFIVAPCINTFGMQHIVAAGTSEGRLDNVLSNAKAVTKRVTYANAHDRLAIVACYGPSLKHNMEPLSAMAVEGGDVISVSGSHDYLLQRGIVPKYHVECDPRPHKADNITSGIHGVQYLLGSVVSPVLVQKLSGFDVALWHLSSELNPDILRLEPDATFVTACMNVGLTSLLFLHRLGYRKFAIYGMDCSFEGTEMWAGDHAQKRDGNKDQTILTVMCGGREFQTSAIYIAYANAFFDHIKVMPDAAFHIYGDHLLQQMSREYMKLQEAA